MRRMWKETDLSNSTFAHEASEFLFICIKFYALLLLVSTPGTLSSVSTQCLESLSLQPQAPTNVYREITLRLFISPLKPRPDGYNEPLSRTGMYIAFQIYRI